MKFFDKEGKEVEAFTQEDLETKNKEVLDAYLKEHPNKSDELAVSNSKLKESQDLLTKKGEELAIALEKKGEAGEEGDDDAKNQQIARLKKEKEDAIESVNSVKTDLSKQINDLKSGMFETLKKKALDKLSGGDEETRKKIEHEFDAYGEAPATEEETLQRLTNAATIVNGTKPQPNFMDNPTKISSSKGEGGNESSANSDEEETENSKAMRKAMQISDKDAEEFGGEGEEK